MAFRRPASHPPRSFNPRTCSLDRWILGELDQLIRDVTDRLEAYDVTPVLRRFERFIDGLSNWYVRCSRLRFWKSADDADKRDAEETLYHVLLTLFAPAGPWTPFVAEHIYRNWRHGRPRVGALDDWPSLSRRRADKSYSPRWTWREPSSRCAAGAPRRQGTGSPTAGRADRWRFYPRRRWRYPRARRDQRQENRLR
ncbi:MAG: class I tRNA ligase family protein [Candidatus Andersenbacteria bacterium]